MANAWLDFVHNFRMKHGNAPLSEIAVHYHSGSAIGGGRHRISRHHGMGLVGGCGDGLMGRGLVGGARTKGSKNKPKAPKAPVPAPVPVPAQELSTPALRLLSALAPLPMASPIEPRPAPKPKQKRLIVELRPRPKIAPAPKEPKAPKEKAIRLTPAQRRFAKKNSHLTNEEALMYYKEDKLAKKLQREKAKEEKKQRGQDRPGYRRHQTVCDLRIALVQRGILPSELYHTVSKQVRHKNGTMSMKNVKVPLKRPELQALLEEFDDRFTLDRND